MLPVSRGVYRWTMSMVTFPARKGDDHAAADPAGDTGPGRPGRAGTPLPHHPRRRDPYPLPDGAAVRPGPHPTPDRAAGAMQPRYRAPGAQALPGRWARRRAAPAAPGAATPLPAWVGAGTGLLPPSLYEDRAARVGDHRSAAVDAYQSLHRCRHER